MWQVFKGTEWMSDNDHLFHVTGSPRIVLWAHPGICFKFSSLLTAISSHLYKEVCAFSSISLEVSLYSLARRPDPCFCPPLSPAKERFLKNRTDPEPPILQEQGTEKAFQQCMQLRGAQARPGPVVEVLATSSAWCLVSHPGSEV